MNQKGFTNIILVVVIAAVVLVGGYFIFFRKPVTNTSQTIKTEPQTQIPASILEKSNQVIISQVGNDFFSKNISLNQSSSKYYQADQRCIQNPNSCSKYLQRPYYLMVYSLKISGKSSVNGLIEFAVDENGNLITERGTYGIPNCLKEPIKCNFSIDESQAITIARGAGLEKGIKPWKSSFNWHAMGIYVWNVQNTLSEDKREGSSGGKSVVIDANTGKVIKITGWSAIP